MRKEKPIEAADASAVAAVHVAVTDNTWNCIMEYEQLHEKSDTAARTQASLRLWRCCAVCFMADYGYALRSFLFHLFFLVRAVCVLSRSCPTPSLSRFQGMDGIYSYKAQVMMRLWGMRPFDRHDWYINRCGKEVKYVIDYYSYETPDPATGETSIDYFIDARPAPTLAGLWDRGRLAFQKWLAHTARTRSQAYAG